MQDRTEIDPSHRILQEINTAFENENLSLIPSILTDLDPVDIAHLLEASPRKTRERLWMYVDPQTYGEILEELSEGVKDSFVTQMDPDTIATMVEKMETDDVAYVLRGLPEDLSQSILAQLDAMERQRIKQALSYQEGTAGSLMSTDVITIRGNIDIDVVLRYLRMRGQLPKTTDALYVIDKSRRLLGRISLRTLLTTAPDVCVADVMKKDKEVILVDTADTEVANLFERRDWISAPVVDAHDCLVGRITIDDVVDVIREDSEHSMMSMAGLDDDEDTFAPVVQSTRKRSFWLGANVLAALLAASVSNLFESTLEQMASIAVLMTIVPSMGGVAGNQTVALVIRALALGHLGTSNQRSLLLKEAAIGALNGLLWASIIGSIVVFWKQDLLLGIVIAIAMLTNLFIAGIAGVIIPLFLKKMRIDPALAGGMALTTITDVVGLFVFLGLATVLFN